MKISRLLEIIDSPTREINLNRKYSGETSARKPKEIGSGIYSSVYDNPADPHTVKKTQSYASSDPFLEYVELIIKHKLWENPHFPRIYGTKYFNFKGGLRRGQWKIERLHKIHTLNLEESKGLVERYFGVETESKYTLIRLLGDLENKKTIENIKDETFKQAAIKIHSLIDDLPRVSFDSTVPRAGLDLHGDNFMIRRTSVGPQVVFMDPFA